jgi:hypothetical protein
MTYGVVVVTGLLASASEVNRKAGVEGKVCCTAVTRVRSPPVTRATTKLATRRLVEELESLLSSMKRARRAANAINDL